MKVIIIRHHCILISGHISFGSLAWLNIDVKEKYGANIEAQNYSFTDTIGCQQIFSFSLIRNLLYL